MDAVPWRWPVTISIAGAERPLRRLGRAARAGRSGARSAGRELCGWGPNRVKGQGATPAWVIGGGRSRMRSRPWPRTRPRGSAGDDAAVELRDRRARVNVLVAGQVGSLVDFDPGPEEHEGGPGMFVAKYGPGGAYRWHFVRGGVGAASIAVDDHGDAYVAGTLTRTTNPFLTASSWSTLPAPGRRRRRPGTATVASATAATRARTRPPAPGLALECHRNFLGAPRVAGGLGGGNAGSIGSWGCGTASRLGS